MEVLCKQQVISLVTLLIIPLVQCGVTYIAAVFEHSPYEFPTEDKIPTLAQARHIMNSNLDAYEEAAIEARFKGAEVIVFPEYGLQGLVKSREYARLYSEDIPEEYEFKKAPCIEQYARNNTPIFSRLSCFAHTNHMIIVANMLNRKKCDGKQGHCHSDGYYFFSTHIAFRPDGFLMSTYPKCHRSVIETKWLNSPSKCTPKRFSYYATFTGPEVLLENPAVILSLRYDAHNLVVPSSWDGAPPLMASSQWLQSWGIRHGVNIITATLHNPGSYRTGSGLFSGADGAKIYYHNNTVFNYNDGTAEAIKLQTGMLLVARLPRNPPKRQVELMPTRDISGPSNKTIIYEKSINGGVFKVSPLTGLEGNVSICEGDVCCHAIYEFTGETRLYSLGFYNGYQEHRSIANTKIYSQICTVLQCPIDGTRECIKVHRIIAPLFNKLILAGSFSTRYVYPSVVATDMDVAPKHWSYGDDDLISKDSLFRAFIKSYRGIEKPLLSATLYGRVYKKDIFQSKGITSGCTPFLHTLCVVLLCVVVPPALCKF
ncbi:unnamed protein product [Owenia fusiformis]|uniref:Uncharacterized protein n=1 Tax=Owenia fusiformis TaxID=6347 RepID=A0A8J1UZT6_OWEFU|nr:unnamed protein product [Owenia fusiformis]